MPSKKFFPFYYVFLLAIAVMGIALVWYSTQLWGGGLISDTYQYVSAGRSLAAGHGFSVPYGDFDLLPMTKYPPMLSMVIALFEIAKINAYGGALYFNIFLFCASIILIALSVKRLTNSKIYSLLAALLLAVSPIMIEVHSWILSGILDKLV